MSYATKEETTGGSSRLSAALQRDVLFYMVGRFLWVSAVQILNVAVGWLIYDVTRSALALGMVGLAAFTPKLVLSLVSGVVADRFERRVICGIAFFVMGVVTLGLLVVASTTPAVTGAVYALFILFGTARGFASPAAQAMVANLVPRDALSRVMGVSSSISQMASIIGPALGGLLYVAGTWAPFAVAAAAFLLASLLNLLISKRPPSRGKSRLRLSDAFEGLHFIRRKPVIMGAISLDLFTVLLGGATALLPMVASEILHLGPLGLGVLRSMPAVGAMMVGLTLAYRPVEQRAGHKLFLATTTFGLATIVLALSQDFYLSLGALWLIGASDVISVVIRQTLVQSDTPDEMRGRVAAVNSLFVGASNELGEFESGVTAAAFGLVPAILIGGLGTVAVSIIWASIFPQLRRRDHLIEP
ncbi:MFS transporter [Rhizobium sp. 1AS11]|uniref:MFS transporter n=1 Tax=Rhizobium acaciae TaxID=2989736 RepID=UPI0022230488|nr:MFS transporter [Rhizobium acaciae]MCW1411277.1 MFS transporter [Rhizobium acaciae]MCW1743311.1 MFS transporter [Rhizobium acaciae]